jgi:thioredoxin 1
MSGYTTDEPSRAEVEALPGPMVIEFGTPWCGHCRRAQPIIAAALARYPDIPHRMIEDGPGRPLGRSFRVMLWPTLVFLRDGRELGRLVRPASEQAIAALLDRIDPP